MAPDSCRIAARLVALGYIPPGIGNRGSFWSEHKEDVITGVALFVAAVILFGLRYRRRHRLSA